MKFNNLFKNTGTKFLIINIYIYKYKMIILKGKNILFTTLKFTPFLDRGGTIYIEDILSPQFFFSWPNFLILNLSNYKNPKDDSFKSN